MSHAIKKGLSKDDGRLHNLYNEISQFFHRCYHKTVFSHYNWVEIHCMCECGKVVLHSS